MSSGRPRSGPRHWRGVFAAAVGLGVLLAAQGAGASEPDAEPRTSDGVSRAPYDPSVFRPDPTYEDKPYDVEAQIEIYGGKTAIDPPRPPIEFGREIYTAGPFSEPATYLGDKNPLAPHLYVYGDLQTVVGFADNGGTEVAQVATRLNLDIDLGITSTERVHAFFRPLERDGEFTRYEFGGNDGETGFDDALDGNPVALFFEGEAGLMLQGITGSNNSIDLPFTGGLMPLVMQNGIWLEDAITGFAFTFPAMNSPMLDISNMDLTFFAGFDEVDSGAFIDTEGKVANHNVNIYGFAAFIEANEGFWEFGYGYSQGEDELDIFNYHNLTLAFTRRYGGWLSNSVRGIWNLGQDTKGRQETAAGGIVFIENSLVTSRPTTLVPYLNLWAGFDRPQGLGQQARGLLKNTGINFETDAITQFPKLDDTGQDTYGAALGVEYLFALDQQLVIEAAVLQVIGDTGEAGRAAVDNQYALGLRYQYTFAKAWILRTDVMYGFREFDDDLLGARLELRRKF